MFKKKNLVILALIITFTSFVSYAYDGTVEAYKNLVNLKVNGKTLASAGDNYTLSNGEETPLSLSYNGTTYLPVRKISEVLDIDVNWDQDTNTIILGEDTTESSSVTQTSTTSKLNFVSLLGDDTTGAFEISTTEVTNQQYVDFLNDAYKKDVYVFDKEKNHIYSKDGYSMIDLNGSRVVKDHNKDGIYALDEMENPLNRCFIEFDESSQKFRVVDPAIVDWNQYFDTSKYPGVVDSIDDWAELNPDKTGFYGNGDTDKLMPTLSEVSNWPANFIRYYGAKEFADFYNYDLPVREQWGFAARGGENFPYATSDGTENTDSSWIQGSKPGDIHKGHVQEVDSLEANPYGIYHLGGNVWEWTKEWASYTSPNAGEKGFGTITEFFVDDKMRDPKIDTSGNDDTSNQYKKSLIGGSFNYFSATMAVTLTEGVIGPTMNLNDDGVWEHGAYIQVGNDHFGFRVVR